MSQKEKRVIKKRKIEAERVGKLYFFVFKIWCNNNVDDDRIVMAPVNVCVWYQTGGLNPRVHTMIIKRERLC